MAANLRPIAQLDFSGGHNLVVNPYLISQKQAAKVQNMILDEHGSLRTRDGQTDLTTSPITDQPIRYRGVLVKVDQTVFPFAVQRTTAGPNRLFRTDTWAQISTDFTTDETLPDAITVTDNSIILNGYEVAIKHTGTSWSRITAGAGQTVPPGAKHGAFHLGSLWLWNTNASTTSLDGPSSLRMSDANNVDSWPNANQTFISKDDGQIGTGMSSFTIVETGISPTATLILFKNYSAYQVTGVFGGATFSVQRIKSDMGCVAPRSIQFVSGFGVIRLTHKGFALYNGVEDRLVSEEVRPAIFGGTIAGQVHTALDFANVDRSWAAQSQNPPLYVAACPVSGTALTRVFIYDLIRRGWTICDFPRTMSCLNLFSTPTTFPRIHAGTLTSGKIVDIFNGATTDNGVAVAWEILTRAFFSSNQMSPAYWRRAHVNLEAPPRTEITITPVVDGIAREGQVRTLPDSTAVQVETVLDVDIMETAHSVQLKITGAGHCRVRGIELHASPKPLTKYRSRA